MSERTVYSADHDGDADATVLDRKQYFPVLGRDLDGDRFGGW